MSTQPSPYCGSLWHHLPDTQNRENFKQHVALCTIVCSKKKKLNPEVFVGAVFQRELRVVFKIVLPPPNAHPFNEREREREREREKGGGGGGDFIRHTLLCASQNKNNKTKKLSEGTKPTRMRTWLTSPKFCLKRIYKKHEVYEAPRASYDKRRRRNCFQDDHLQSFPKK